MRRTRKWLLALGALVAIAPMLTACYATHGAGEDLQAAGRGISNSADKNTTYRP
jgi:predicted small secreted protein